MALDLQTVADTVAEMNIKAFGSADSLLPITSAQNSLSHLKRIELIAESGLQAWQNRLVTPDVTEAISAKEMLTGNRQGDNAMVAAMAQIMAKLGQTTPPVTS